MLFKISYTKKIIFFISSLVSLYINGQTNNFPLTLKKDFELNPNKIVGKWVDFYPISKITSMDSIERILKTSNKYETEYLDFMEDFYLSFTKDSILMAYDTETKYYIDNTSCSLVTISNSKVKKTQIQKIFVLNDDFLVIQRCTNECFTMFYRKLRVKKN